MPNHDQPFGGAARNTQEEVAMGTTSATKIVPPSLPGIAGKAEFIEDPEPLMFKVSVGGPGAVDDAVLEGAEAAIADLADSYQEWVQDDLNRLRDALESLKADPMNDERLQAVFAIVHDMKGQGGSFGYDLVTRIGHQLCRFIDGMDRVIDRNAAIQVIGFHVEALTLVISRNLKGDGGADGAHLEGALARMISKVDS